MEDIKTPPAKEAKKAKPKATPEPHHFEEVFQATAAPVMNKDRMEIASRILAEMMTPNLRPHHIEEYAVISIQAADILLKKLEETK